MRSAWQKSDPKWLAYALEVNPWTPPEELRDAVLYRGAIVSAWAAIDTTLAEIALRASISDSYRSIDSKYPYSSKSKIKYLRQVLYTPGPLGFCKILGDQMLARYEKSTELRHQMAHASMRVLPNWGATFIDYIPDKDGSITQRRHRYSVNQLEFLARKTTRLSRIMQKGKTWIDDLNALPKLPFE